MKPRLLTTEIAAEIIKNTSFGYPHSRMFLLGEAIHKICAANINALKDLPIYDVSAMDGYAIHATERKRSYSILKHVLKSDTVLREGETVYVHTGERIPAGTSFVARIEVTKSTGEGIETLSDIRKGKDIRKRGDDMRTGDKIVSRGEIITPYHLGALIAQGFREVEAFDIRVSLIAIGDEILDSFATGPGVNDSITPILRSILSFATMTEKRIVKDNVNEISCAINEALDVSDVVITIGGSSIGRRDVTKQAVRSIGIILFEGVTTNVLKRGSVGVVKGKPIIILPGHAISAITVFLADGLDVFSRMVGTELRRFKEVTLDEEVETKHNMNSTFLFKFTESGAIPLKWGTSSFLQLSAADAFGVLQRGRTYHRGEKIRVQEFISKY